MKAANYSIARAIRGPVTLITIGSLFALNNFTTFKFGETWPVLLIVFGLLSLLGRSAERGVMPPPPYTPPYTPPPAGPGPSYRQTSYAEPPNTATMRPPDPVRQPGETV